MNLTTMSAVCSDQSLRLTASPVIAGGGVNETMLSVEFSDEWDGFEKTAVFYRNEDSVFHVMLEDGECLVPCEVLAEPGAFYFGIMGVHGDTLKTTEVLRYPVRMGAATQSNAVSAPTPDIYSQLLSRVSAVEQMLSRPSFTTDDTLSLTDGILSVSTADAAEEDNALPITSAAVYSEIHAIPTTVVDSALSDTSENPVQNKVISAALNGKFSNPVQLTDQDLHRITTPGFYYAAGGNTVVNKPSGYGAFGLLVYKNAGGYIIQEFTATNTPPDKFICMYNGSTWSGWQRMNYALPGGAVLLWRGNKVAGQNSVFNIAASGGDTGCTGLGNLGDYKLFFIFVSSFTPYIAALSGSVLTGGAAAYSSADLVTQSITASVSGNRFTVSAHKSAKASGSSCTDISPNITAIYGIPTKEA